MICKKIGGLFRALFPFKFSKYFQARGSLWPRKAIRAIPRCRLRSAPKNFETGYQIPKGLSKYFGIVSRDHYWFEDGLSLVLHSRSYRRSASSIRSTVTFREWVWR